MVGWLWLTVSYGKAGCECSHHKEMMVLDYEWAKLLWCHYYTVYTCSQTLHGTPKIQYMQLLSVNFKKELFKKKRKKKKAGLLTILSLYVLKQINNNFVIKYLNKLYIHKM
jgi:uncharacterized membrane protein YwzB